jgi:hypothetical protein
LIVGFLLPIPPLRASGNKNHDENPPLPAPHKWPTKADKEGIFRRLLCPVKSPCLPLLKKGEINEFIIPSLKKGEIDILIIFLMPAPL